jgi:hypothetical protein
MVDGLDSPRLPDRLSGWWAARTRERSTTGDASDVPEPRSLDRFGAVLVLTVFTTTVLALVDTDLERTRDLRSDGFATLVSLSTGVTLVLALRASGAARRWRRIAEVFIIVAAVGSVATLIAEHVADIDVSPYESDRPSPLWVGVAVVTPIAVIRRLLKHRRVSAGTMQGAISAYLLIAIAFCLAFLFLDGADGPFFAGDQAQPSTSFMYFSLVTITTVGYGDLAAASPLGRLVATSEAVIGQVYLVTFVAMLVGLMIQQRDDDTTDRDA